MSEGVKSVATDAGMLSLWRESAFVGIDGYDNWERRVEARLGEAIHMGELIPVGIQGDGAFGVRVAIAPGQMSERESRHTVVTSEPYLLVSDGGPIHLSGIEAVGDAASSPVTFSLPAGRYAVRVSLIAWDDEPGARGPDGRPTAQALPDFLVVIEPSGESETFRQDEVTFDPLE